MARVSECSTQCRDGKGTTATTTTATTILPLPLSPSASMAGLRAYGAETSTMAIRLSFSPLTPSKRRALEGGAPGRGRGCQRGLGCAECGRAQRGGHDRSAVGGDGDQLGTTGFDGKLTHLCDFFPLFFFLFLGFSTCVIVRLDDYFRFSVKNKKIRPFFLSRTEVFFSASLMTRTFLFFLFICFFAFLYVLSRTTEKSLIFQVSSHVCANEC
uniref:Uncharacterized protein n=1 Tax=Oryza sativa subsp. japonica TaxID=39947 RepID=Q6Z9X1_ORYSJ|nr:hypothetical protein [Oryza sativa Japonica Group]